MVGSICGCAKTFESSGTILSGVKANQYITQTQAWRVPPLETKKNYQPHATALSCIYIRKNPAHNLVLIQICIHIAAVYILSFPQFLTKVCSLKKKSSSFRPPLKHNKTEPARGRAMTVPFWLSYGLVPQVDGLACSQTFGYPINSTRRL